MLSQSIANKECNVTIRVTDDFKKDIKERAKALNMKPSEYVRFLIVTDLKESKKI